MPTLMKANTYGYSVYPLLGVKNRMFDLSATTQFKQYFLITFGNMNTGV